MSQREESFPGRAARQVLARFERWRKGNRRGQAIPNELWRQAGTLASDEGLNRVSKYLRLNHTSLKGWLPSSKESSEAAEADPFVELSPRALDHHRAPPMISCRFLIRTGRSETEIQVSDQPVESIALLINRLGMLT